GAAVSLQEARIGAVLTRLGENVTDETEASAVADHYHTVLEEAVRRGVDVEPSVKLTQLGLDLDREVAFGHLDALAEHATKLRGYVWVDMEGSAYTDVTLELYERVRERHENVGLCLQAYLH